ncbi:hypothetical protein ACHAWT_001554 [Skeletonema menzelii]
MRHLSSILFTGMLRDMVFQSGMHSRLSS